jgi:hypothetical protein
LNGSTASSSACEQDQITGRDGETYLTLDRHELIIPPRLAVLLCQLPKPRGASTLPPNPAAPKQLFPGRAFGEPVSAGASGRRLKKHGVTVRGGRNTALISLAGDLPAPVLADLFCLSSTTGVRWTRYAERDWESYLADRRAKGRADSL